ncbi:MAG: hypothetical protein QXP04_05300, partial [Candidatus Nanoarchaeia archaeon]|nr:hypothetical protein [Candidatus Jingweiarchaeum tengchongense]
MKIVQKVLLFLLFTLIFVVLVRCAAGEMNGIEEIGRLGKDSSSNLTDAPEYQYDSGYQYDYGNIRDTGYIEPEKTNPYASVPPITSDKYLFILNQVNNSITVIEPETLKVFSIKMDFSPKNLIVIPHTEYAIVLAENASKISMISINDGKAEVFSFQLGQQYND